MKMRRIVCYSARWSSSFARVCFNSILFNEVQKKAIKQKVFCILFEMKQSESTYSTIDTNLQYTKSVTENNGYNPILTTSG